MKVFSTLTVFKIFLLSNIIKICSGFELRVSASPGCPEGRYKYSTHNVTATLVKNNTKKTKGENVGLCGFVMTVSANVSIDEYKIKVLYANYTYSNSTISLIKKIPEDCVSKDDFTQYDPWKNIKYRLCSLGYLDPNPKTESEPTTPKNDNILAS
uniref:Uncharacterized protein n=1 Tax=Strongyloides venezuelensis TaxID=75913 RepID=A0A0K0EZL2_STRVS